MAKFSSFLLICCLTFLLLLVSSNTTNAESAIDAKRKEILTRRDSHKRRITALIKHMRSQLADHSAGVKVMEEKEKADLERRLALYVQKVDSMKEYVDDEEVETTMAREESQKKHRANYKEKIIAEARRLEEEKEKKSEDANYGSDDL
ncbi:unnamed protein product [Cylindrotheca closterium]|uniref:Uncharacterized protein n=1 Tax=Cylindrotheca closterium TaxID=2856 RepID=A0AAD2JHA0_9STRA|nr:unnamed protein product [Cylindrotheca closterium]